MLAGIKEVLIISTPTDLPFYENLFGSGESLGALVTRSNRRQMAWRKTFIIGEEFIGDDKCALGYWVTISFWAWFYKKPAQCS